MNIEESIARLIERVRDLEDRVDALESIDRDVLSSCIGYEIGDPDEFDEDASEY